ncbi:MAG TPA: DUF5317 family protein [Actinomycetota bacterium]|nr:DUF5317 family protein [Actinomycetota bacterium]
MILALVVAVIAAVFGLIRGGSLDALSQTKLRWLPLLFGALVFQAGFDLWNPDWLSDTGDLAVLLVSHVAVAVFFALNWKLAGMALAAAGFVLNVIVIAANGAMPVSQRASELAGLEDVGELGVKHELLDDGTAVPWLADVIPVPGTGKVVSLGDVLLAAGIGWLVYRRTTAMDSEDAEEARPSTPRAASG